STGVPRSAPDRASRSGPKPTIRRGPGRESGPPQPRGKRSPPAAWDRSQSGSLADWLRSLSPCPDLASPPAGQEGFEPPTRGFGDRCSTVGATGLDLSFLVRRVLPAARTELA